MRTQAVSSAQRERWGVKIKRNSKPYCRSQDVEGRIQMQGAIVVFLEKYLIAQGIQTLIFRHLYPNGIMILSQRVAGIFTLFA